MQKSYLTTSSQQINLKLREFHKINCNKNEKCQEYLNLFKKMTGKAQYILTHSIVRKNIKRKIKSKGSFPTIDSAFKILYLTT